MDLADPVLETKIMTLGDVATPTSLKAGPESDLPVYAVTKHRGFVPSAEYFSKQVFSRDTSGYKLVRRGEFAYATIHLDEGSIGIAPEDSLVSPMYTSFVVDESIVDPSYLLLYLKSPRAMAVYPQLGKGSAERRKSISFTRLKGLTVPLPPLNEQRRLAAILHKADELRTKRRQALVRLDALTLSIFHSMFGDPVNNSRGWPQQKLNTLGRITTGNTPSRAVLENFGDYIEWVKTDNINTPSTVLTAAREGLSEQGLRKGRAVPSGSVLVTCIAGSPGVIGNVALVDRPVAFNQQINAFTPNSGPSLYWYALLKAMKPLIQKASSGGMKGLVSKSALSAIETIVVPDSIQTDFAERLAAAERLKRHHESQLAELDALFRSLQHRAFRREL